MRNISPTFLLILLLLFSLSAKVNAQTVNSKYNIPSWSKCMTSNVPLSDDRFMVVNLFKSVSYAEVKKSDKEESYMQVLTIFHDNKQVYQYEIPLNEPREGEIVFTDDYVVFCNHRGNDGYYQSIIFEKKETIVFFSERVDSTLAFIGLDYDEEKKSRVGVFTDYESCVEFCIPADKHYYKIIKEEVY